jgi:hypothetical protein
VLVYLSLGWVLLRMPTVRDFFAEKRGEPRSHDLLAEKAAVATEPDVPVAFTADQIDGVHGLAQYLRWNVWALLTLGALQILVSLVGFSTGSVQPLGLLLLGQGILIVIVGMALGGPSNEVRPLTTPEEQTKGQLLDAFASFVKFYKVQLIVGLVLCVVLVARFVVTLTGIRF